MRIKICGITRYEDARIAANLGVDALGFIFYPQSSRYISPVNAAEIIKKLPPFISRTGVFVDEDPNRVVEITALAGLDTVQLHGNESPEYCAAMPVPVIKVFSIHDKSDISKLSDYKVSGYLLDTWSPDRKGGTGKIFDWSVAAKACSIYNTVILSGGLGPSNLQEAMETVRPFAVDVNSGVEISPGVKSPPKMKDAISIVKSFQ
ncbi:MAG: phosphoribosylanthranilate isomerase [Chitinispirillales bacterium]|nr:phosphoribosylanthranilate isomerase [Chitinispirillales bacterium]